MTGPNAWSCPTCRKRMASAFCPDCGERQLDVHALTLRGLAEHVFLSLTSVDSKLIRSLLWLVGKPGALTVAYLEGRRKSYLGPVPLFLMANVLFFAAESLLHSSVFSTPLTMHLEKEPWSPFAQDWVAQRIAALHTTLDAFAPIFDQALALHARSLIIVMALSFTPLPMVLYLRRHMPVAAHAVFALHLYAFLLLLLCLGTGVEALFGGPTAMPALVDPLVSIALLAACAAYLYRAVRAVYAAHGARRIVEVAALTVGVAALVLGYRFALFVLTLYTANIGLARAA